MKGEKKTNLVDSRKEIIQLKEDFKDVRRRLDKLDREYNPQRHNLHFYSVSKADMALFRELLELAKEDLRLINAHRDYCLNVSLYDDGYSTYDLFLLIGASANRARTDKNQKDIHLSLIIKLIDVLRKICFFTTNLGGDIYKRNQEALGNILFAFRSKRLFNYVLECADKNKLERVKTFLLNTVDLAKGAIADEVLGP